jgi:hypothetical protein
MCISSFVTSSVGLKALEVVRELQDFCKLSLGNGGTFDGCDIMEVEAI